MVGDGSGLEGIEITARLGISIESLDVVLSYKPTIYSAAINPALASSITEEDIQKLSLHIIDHFRNFAASFAITNPADGQQYVPASVLDKWHLAFMNKVKRDPTFLIQQ